jgi:hypothetical protein
MDELYSSNVTNANADRKKLLFYNIINALYFKN